MTAIVPKARIYKTTTTALERRRLLLQYKSADDNRCTRLHTFTVQLQERRLHQVYKSVAYTRCTRLQLQYKSAADTRCTRLQLQYKSAGYIGWTEGVKCTGLHYVCKSGFTSVSPGVVPTRRPVNSQKTWVKQATRGRG